MGENLLVRIKLEALITRREAAKALNEWRFSRAEAQAYGENEFLALEQEMLGLIREL